MWRNLILILQGAMERKKPEHLEGVVRLMRHLEWALPLMLSFMATAVELLEHRLDKQEPWTESYFLGELAIFALVGPVLVFLVLVFTTRILQYWQQAILELRELNQELEDKVAARTQELAEKNKALARANAELRELDQLKSDFIALVSHELITPLTTINGGLELLLSSPGEVPPTVQHRLTLLARETNRLTQLVRRILEVSRLEAGKLKLTFGPVAPRPLLTRVAAALDAPQHPVQMHFEGPTPLLWGDELYLEEILRNLLRNAQQHTPPRTPIQVAVFHREEEGALEITITDWGPGIPPEVQKHIFSAFYQVVQGEQRQASGWGLGLYLARRLAELHNGRLWVESPVFPDAERPGTRFHLVLPVLNEEEPFEEETRHVAPANR